MTVDAKSLQSVSGAVGGGFPSAGAPGWLWSETGPAKAGGMI